MIISQDTELKHTLDNQCIFFSRPTCMNFSLETQSTQIYGTIWIRSGYLFKSLRCGCLDNSFIYSVSVALTNFYKMFSTVPICLQAAKDNGVALPTTVHEIMNTWVLQMGFPVVTVNTTTGQVDQKHFLLDPDSTVTVVSPYKYVHFFLSFFFSPQMYFVIQLYY